MNQSHGLSYDETMFLSHQKVSKVKIAGSYSKEDQACIQDFQRAGAQTLEMGQTNIKQKRIYWL